MIRAQAQAEAVFFSYLHQSNMAANIYIYIYIYICGRTLSTLRSKEHIFSILGSNYTSMVI